jgi:hypothetical protein
LLDAMILLYRKSTVLQYYSSSMTIINTYSTDYRHPNKVVYPLNHIHTKTKQNNNDPIPNLNSQKIENPGYFTLTLKSFRIAITIHKMS